MTDADSEPDPAALAGRLRAVQPTETKDDKNDFTRVFDARQLVVEAAIRDLCERHRLDWRDVASAIVRKHDLNRGGIQ